MGFLVPLTLFGWIPFVLLLFLLLPPRRAVITAFLAAWLFLPIASYGLHGLPDYTKMSATCVGVLMAAVIFDGERIFGFRPKWVDIPMFVFCFSPMVSSYLNQLGMYDGCAVAVRMIVTWGLPYLIGRVYFTDLEAIRELAIGLFCGGLIYVPLCWLEIRMSPQLHLWVYGYHQHAFVQTIREGGYRPMVFMQHGLMVAMWMAMTTLVGAWLWRAKSVLKFWDMPMSYLVWAMFITTFFCKSKYALLLMVAGFGVLMAAKWIKIKWVVIAFLMIPPAFMYLRASGIVTGESLVAAAEKSFGEERAASLAYRVANENALAARAMEQPWFGWGTWGAARVQDDDGKDRVTDSLWIIQIGNAGIVGLVALTLTLLLPMIVACFDWRVELWLHPMVAPVIVLGMMTSLYMFDHLMNGMVNPIFMLALGAVSSAHYAVPAVSRRQMPQQMRRPTQSDQTVTPANFRPA